MDEDRHPRYPLLELAEDSHGRLLHSRYCHSARWRSEGDVESLS
jgi:hypothetical protein